MALPKPRILTLNRSRIPNPGIQSLLRWLPSPGGNTSLGNVVPGVQSRAMMGSRPAGIGNREVHPTQILILISFHANADQHFYASCLAFSLLEKGRKPNFALSLHTPVEIVMKFCSEKCDWFFLNHLFTHLSRHIVFLFLAVIT